MNQAIGGYFEMELRQGEHFHKNALKLNTARNCLKYILKAKGYKKIYIPYYTCEVILEPIKKQNVDYEFYAINQQLEPVNEYKLSAHEAFLYTNYFGLKQDTVLSLAACYGTNLIVDNSQAFFAQLLENIDTFYSARKFFGVPDGAYLYTDKYLDEDLEQDNSYMRMSHLLKRIDIGAESGYFDFQQNDNSLNNQPIKQMSNLTDRLLKSIDYKDVKEIRQQNFIYMHKHLEDKNLLHLPYNQEYVPMVYPFLSERSELKQKLIQEQIFAATYWINVLSWLKKGVEINLVKHLIPLPIDQRLGVKEMNKIITIIEKNYA